MQNILLGFKMSMAVIYTAIGVYLLTHPNFFEGISKEISFMLGVIFVLFGIFRGYRAWFIERNA
ncbi:MAG: hypothetical protein ACTHJT_17900 [Cytophaga sp.]|uniref:hypothetical protein n=1 Tax=Cytophaga sp. TaxID=29535 RepID=UPI003F7E3601